MARQKGTTKFKGRIGDYTGYLLNGEYILRSLPKTDTSAADSPSYEGRRQTSTEFGNVSKDGKFFRQILWPFIGDVAQKQLDNPVNTLFNIIKNNDPAPKGERTVAGGLLLSEMRDLFQGFELNKHVKVSRFLHTRPVCDMASGTVTFPGFSPETHLDFPKFATHALFSICGARLDFGTRFGTISIGEAVEVTPDMEAHDLILRTTIPDGAGLGLLLLKVVFIERGWGKDEVVKGGAVVLAVGLKTD